MPECSLHLALIHTTSTTFREAVLPDLFTLIVCDVAPKPWEQINSEHGLTEN